MFESSSKALTACARPLLPRSPVSNEHNNSDHFFERRCYERSFVVRSFGRDHITERECETRRTEDVSEVR